MASDPQHADSVSGEAPESAYEGRQSNDPEPHDPRAGRGPATGGAAESQAHAPDRARREREREGGGAPSERD
jgi:hypothetical protein